MTYRPLYAKRMAWAMEYLHRALRSHRTIQTCRWAAAAPYIAEDVRISVYSAKSNLREARRLRLVDSRKEVA